MTDTKKPDEIKNQLQQLTGDRNRRAKAWQAKGGKVVGYVSNTIPLELIHAAGLFPLHLSGTPGEDTPLADEFLEPAFDPWSRSLFEKLIRGDYRFLDAIILPRTHDALQRLYYYLCEIERKHPQYSLPPVFLVNLLHTPRASTTAYNRARFAQFAEFLQSLGNRFDDAALENSIDTYNRLRSSLSYFNRLRASADRPVSGFLAQQVYAAVQSLPAEESLSLLSQVETLAEPTPDARPIVLAGSCLDHPQLHQLLDREKLCVVGDYHSLGNHFLGPTPVPAPELTALAEHYQYHTLSGRSFEQKETSLVDFARQQNAQAIVFHYLLKEEALSWHYPRQQRAAEAAGLQTALLIDQPYQPDPSRLQNLVRTLGSQS